jgi:hypothetical protein
MNSLMPMNLIVDRAYLNYYETRSKNMHDYPFLFESTNQDVVPCDNITNISF